MSRAPSEVFNNSESGQERTRPQLPRAVASLKVLLQSLTLGTDALDALTMNLGPTPWTSKTIQSILQGKVW